MRSSQGRWLAHQACIACVLACTAVHAQEAMYTSAATMPSPGVTILRQQFHFYQFGRTPGHETEKTQFIEWETGVQLGIARDWSVNLDIPVKYQKEWHDPGSSLGDTHIDRGVEDLDLMFKWRFFKDDSGGINTSRAALLFGAEFPSGDDHDFSSMSVNPHLGVVYTRVIGRHGFNLEARYLLNTGGDNEHNFGGDSLDDALLYNAAYVYRIFPDRYAADSNGAWYVTAEFNGIYETSGDNEARFAPGVMYEGRRWAFEAMLQLPFISDLDERAELDYGAGFGFRFTF